MALGQYGEDLVLNFLLSNSIPAPFQQYLALYTSNPTALDVGSEISVTGTNYSRRVISFGASISGLCLNSGVVIFPVATSNWGTITYLGIRDAMTGGHLLVFPMLGSPISVNSGDVLEFPIGTIQIAAS
jgi:hypothetical protein